MPLYELISIIWSLWPVTTRTRNPGTNTPQKTYKYPEGDLYSFFCWNGMDLAHHSHARAMSTRTWNNAHGNGGIRIWALDLGVSAFLPGLLFLFAFFIFPFPHRFGLFPPCCVFLILAFYSHTTVPLPLLSCNPSIASLS